ncbi:MAG TPA: polymer-forming cytoskeletal protein [Thermoanaerobaculia bacterium]|nr:polymer-forming cytoskeletal protein [Thermoanaerobaculia bacterium]
MFKQNDQQRDLNGFLDRGSTQKGELSFEASFRIDGKYEGTIRSSGRLVVGEGGLVDGDVQVRHVLVSGEVRGSVEAGEQLHIAPGGRVHADITTPSLVIEDGAIFEGNCTMTKAGKATGTGGDVAKLVVEKG